MYTNRERLQRIVSTVELTSTIQSLSSAFQADVMMVADFSMYKYFFQLFENNIHLSKIATEDYLEAVFEQVRQIVGSNIIMSNESISLRLVGTLVIKHHSECPFHEMCTPASQNPHFTTAICNASLDALFAIELLQKWLPKTFSSYTLHEHVVVLTKYDLLSVMGDSGTQGMAYVGTFCQESGSVSIAEDIGGMATALIVAHELMHSFGVFHDGKETNNECEAKANHLMAPLVLGTEDTIKFSNSFKLSSCSKKQLAKALRNETLRCLKKGGINSRRINNYNSLQKFHYLPGELICQEKQCKIAFGQDYGICEHWEYYERTDPCLRLWCQNKSINGNDLCETKSYLPLFDGTKCGENKVSLTFTYPVKC